MAFLLGQLEEPFSYAVRVTLLTALYGAILTPILYPLLRRVIEGLEPDEGGAVLDGAVLLPAEGVRDPGGA